MTHVNVYIAQGDVNHNWREDDAPPPAGLLPEAGPAGVFGAVIGYDGSGAPLPDIGPYDFSSATRVSGVPAMGSSEGAVRMSLAPLADAPQYVVKACASAGHAAQAWLASRLFGAVGLATPTAMLVKGCSQAFDNTLAPERVHLATTFLSGYRDLGEWIEGDDAWRVFEGAGHRAPAALRHVRDEALAAGVRMAQVLREAGGLPFHALHGASARAYADALGYRNAMRLQLCHALPDVYQCALERHYIAGLWLGNWDMSNVFMENIGVWRDKNDLPCAMSLDFDACLHLGFQGRLKENAYDVALKQREAVPSLPALTSTFRRDAAAFDATLPEDALADLSQFPYGEHYAPFVRRFAGFAREASTKTIVDELRNPTSVRAVAAEMAYRLGRISALQIRPWAEAAYRVGQAGGGMASDAEMRHLDPETLVNHLLRRRDSLVQLLGGPWAAQTWAHMYSTRAEAVDAQQAPFLSRDTT
ncbi:hypothetical protein AB870_04215 [Pandoraea faecigallinarum]|uniref:Uncharacterized protein n=1 Tax=Pandoraea faecigallinarum TaxID=656179 RepID=A0A0H3WSH2_9BURK|nr:hypothetical protein [Pandoraea faecigallinarum]AKM29511.1 hypothetical protein AB870_04215 [Pandoraea faecigallinarum]